MGIVELFAGRYSGIALRHNPTSKTATLLQPIITDHGIIPIGFTCDLDTVPRHLGPLYAWFKGRTILGAVVHDYCYRERVGRKKADDLFLKTMEWEGVRKRYRLPIYWAVRVFGGAWY